MQTRPFLSVLLATILLASAASRADARAWGPGPIGWPEPQAPLVLAAQTAQSPSSGDAVQGQALARFGAIAFYGEVDAFTRIMLPTHATRSITYSFRVTGSTIGFNPFLTLRVVATGRVFTDNDSGPGRNSFFRLTVNPDPRRRPVRVDAFVSAFRHATLGFYTLSVTP